MKNHLFSIMALGALGAVALVLLSNAAPRQKAAPKGEVLVAPRPPMGWNSFDAYDCRINEAEFKATVDFMAEHLKPYGWEYAVVDYIWFNPEPGNWKNPRRRFGHPDVRMDAQGRPLDKLVMDENARLLPATERFPSAAGGKGFKPLADYVHAKGLKFGIHIMRGVARQAYFENLPIKGTNYRVQDIAEPWDTCNWCNNMYGVDPTKPGAQAYYNSLFKLYASWGVDFIKADDTMFPPYHKGEIEMMRKAIDQCGRPMVLSLSCGEAPLSQAAHLAKNANMWRVSADFWDDWEDLKHSFDLLNAWSPHIQANHWPDADMLPLGKLSINNRPHGPERMSKFTRNEQFTLMTLWCMARSPLIMGGDLLTTPDSVLALLKNKEVLQVNMNSKDNRQIINHQGKAIWIAKDPLTGDSYVALFNLKDDEQVLRFDFELEYLRGQFKVRDLWAQKDLGNSSKALNVKLGPHACGLFRLSKTNEPANGPISIVGM